MPAKLRLILFLGLLNVLLPILYLLFGNTTPGHLPTQARPSAHKVTPTPAQARPSAHKVLSRPAHLPTQARPSAHKVIPTPAHLPTQVRLSVSAHKVTPVHPPTQTRPSAHKARVLIIAHGRSGSSFFGGIFNAHPDIFFIYEPLNTLARITSMSSDAFLHQAEHVMRSIVTCSFSDGPFLEKLSLFNHHRASSKPLVSPPFCNTTRENAIDFVANHRWEVCVDEIGARDLHEVCNNYSHVFTKILLERLQPAGLSWALHVSGEYSFPVHILYLVRDPRPMIFSRYKIGWIAPNIRLAHSLVSGEAEEIVEEICENMERNLAELVRQPDRMELVRYEDLATKPEVVVKHLFKVLRISPSEEVLSWIRNKSHGPLNDNIFSLSRPGDIVLNAWRKNIPVELLKIIEKKCQRVMRYLGYIPINGSTALLRDLDKPLFSKQPKVNLNMSLEV